MCKLVKINGKLYPEDVVEDALKDYNASLIHGLQSHYGEVKGAYTEASEWKGHVGLYKEGEIWCCTPEGKMIERGHLGTITNLGFRREIINDNLFLPQDQHGRIEILGLKEDMVEKITGIDYEDDD